MIMWQLLEVCQKVELFMATIESFARARLTIPSEGPGASSHCKLNQGRKGVKEALSAKVGLSVVEENLSVDNILLGLLCEESIFECLCVDV